MALTIRPERPEDFAAIHELVRQAFSGAEHTNGDEHFLVDRLRRTPDYIPELSLVAVEEGQIVGNCMFTTLRVGAATALALAPLSVLPSWQGNGVGGALIRHGHAVARSLGWDFVILVGHAGYYPRFGYKRAASFGITAPFDLPEEAFMAISLNGSSSLPGQVAYSTAFFPEG